MDTIDIEMVALSLVSVSPVTVGTDFFDVFVMLDPAMPSLGSMTIRHEFDDGTGPVGSTYQGDKPTSGMFDSLIDVAFIAAFTPVSTGSAFVVPGLLPLESLGTLWAHGDSGEFLIVNPFVETHPSGAMHTAQQVDSTTVIPEPSTFAIWSLLGALGITTCWWRRRRWALSPSAIPLTQLVFVG